MKPLYWLLAILLAASWFSAGMVGAADHVITGNIIMGLDNCDVLVRVLDDGTWVDAEENRIVWMPSKHDSSTTTLCTMMVITGEIRGGSSSEKMGITISEDVWQKK